MFSPSIETTENPNCFFSWIFVSVSKMKRNKKICRTESIDFYSTCCLLCVLAQIAIIRGGENVVTAYRANATWTMKWFLLSYFRFRFSLRFP